MSYHFPACLKLLSPPDFSVRSWEGLAAWGTGTGGAISILTTRLLPVSSVCACRDPALWLSVDTGVWGGEKRAQGLGVGARGTRLSLWFQDS